MAHMAQVAMLTDVQPIRASCFSPSGEYFVLGTNSKALKICALPARINKGDASLEIDEDDTIFAPLDGYGSLGNPCVDVDLTLPHAVDNT